MISAFRKKKVKRLFEAYDANCNGYLDMNDLIVLTERVCKEFQWRSGSQQENSFKSAFFKIWSKLFREADVNNDHKVTYKEFCKYYHKIISSEEEFYVNLKPYMDELFVVMDTDNDYLLSKQDFINFFNSFATETENAEEVFEAIDNNGDGKISHLEFYNTFYEFHMSDDSSLPSKNLFGMIK